MTPVVSAWDSGRPRPTAIDTRASFTSQVSDEVISRATYGGDPDPGGLSASVACCGFYSRAFAMAEVEPEGLRGILTPVLLASVGRLLSATGNFVADVSTDADGQRVLLPTGDYELAGQTPNPAEWAYQLRYLVPSRREPITRRRVAGAVIHVKVNEDPLRPWLGRSAVATAGLTAQYASRLEKSLAADSNARVLYIIPVPDGTPPARLAALRNNLRLSDGNVQLAESMQSGWGSGRLASPSRDWESRRVGPQLQAPNVAAQSAVWNQVTAAFGIHGGMWTGSGVDARESQRQAFLNGVLPTAEIVAWTLSETLGQRVSLSFDRAMYSDLRSRSNAFAQFVAAGLTPQQALVMIGLSDDALIPATPATPPTPTPTGDRGVPDSWAEYRRAHGLPELNGQG